MVVVVDVVVVVVVILVGAYAPVTGYRAHQLRSSTPRDDARPMNPVGAYSGPLLDVTGMGAGESHSVSCDAPPSLGGDAPPDKGVDTSPDEGSRTSPGKDSAGAIRMARLLLVLSLDVMATDDEAMRAFSTGSSSFAIPNVSSATGPPKEMTCSARGVNGQGQLLHSSVAAVKTGPNGRAPLSSTRALAG